MCLASGIVYIVSSVLVLLFVTESTHHSTLKYFISNPFSDVYKWLYSSIMICSKMLQYSVFSHTTLKSFYFLHSVFFSHLSFSLNIAEVFDKEEKSSESHVLPVPGCLVPPPVSFLQSKFNRLLK